MKYFEARKRISWMLTGIKAIRIMIDELGFKTEDEINTFISQAVKTLIQEDIEFKTTFNLAGNDPGIHIKASECFNISDESVVTSITEFVRPAVKLKSFTSKSVMDIWVGQKADFLFTECVEFKDILGIGVLNTAPKIENKYPKVNIDLSLDVSSYITHFVEDKNKYIKTDYDLAINVYRSIFIYLLDKFKVAESFKITVYGSVYIKLLNCVKQWYSMETFLSIIKPLNLYGHSKVTNWIKTYLVNSLHLNLKDVSNLSNETLLNLIESNKIRLEESSKFNKSLKIVLTYYSLLKYIDDYTFEDLKSSTIFNLIFTETQE